MKTIILISVLLLAVVIALGLKSAAQKQKQHRIDHTPQSFYSLQYVTIHGDTISMEQYRGKYVLCVNVASKCGYTPQYEGLQALFEKYADRLVIIGFPCNQFLGQEPGTESEIASFCSKNYGVTFPLAAKLNVKGSNQHPIYTWLTSKALNSKEDHTVSWNFNKFLISPQGEWLAYFDSKVLPLSTEIESFLN